MGKLLDIADKMKGLTESSIEKTILKSFKDNEKVIAKLNTEQLYAGEFVTGKKLPEYSENSVKVFGKRPGPWQLFNKGNYYAGWFVKADKFDIVFGSNDLKAGMIADAIASKGDNPDDLYGLDKANLSITSKKIVLPDLQKFVRSFFRV